MLPLLTPIVSASGWVGWSVHVCTLSSAPPVLPHAAVINPSSRTPSKNFCSLMVNVEIAPPYCGVYIRLYWIFSPIFEAKYLFVLIYYWSENFLLDMCAVFIEIDVFFGWLQYFFLHAPLLCVGDSMYCTLCCYVHFPPLYCALSSHFCSKICRVWNCQVIVLYIFLLWACKYIFLVPLLVIFMGI